MKKVDDDKLSIYINAFGLIGGIFYIIVVGLLSIPTLFFIRDHAGYANPIIIKSFTIFITVVPQEIPIAINSDYLTIIILEFYLALGIIDILRNINSDKPLIKMFLLAGVVLVLSILIEALQSSIGVETGELEAPNDYIYYISAVYAPIGEEIGFRLTIIGLASLIMYFLSRKEKTLKGALTSFLIPYKIYKDDHDKMYVLYILVIFTSLVFGFAHLMGPGWKLGKVTLSILAGLYLGYLFVKYGITTSILGHAYFNVYLLTLYFLSELAGDYIPTYGEIVEVTISVLYFILSITIGVIYLVWLAYKFVKRYSGYGVEYEI